jgi:hypothetical protein
MLPFFLVQAARLIKENGSLGCLLLLFKWMRESPFEPSLCLLLRDKY